MSSFKEQIMDNLLSQLNSNGGKLLNLEKSRGKYFIWQRDRQRDQSYFLTKIRGNHIVAYRVRYENQDGSGVNTFLNISIPALCGETPKLLIKKEVEILRVPVQRWEEFAEKFRDLTPSLEWFDWEEELTS